MNTPSHRDHVDAHLRTYKPTTYGFFRPERIILTRGTLDTPARAAFAHRLCDAFPYAQRIEAPDRTHMQLSGLLPKGDDARRAAGHRTLVLGTIGTPVRRSRERDIACPNYLHFSPTGLCTYACTYCYLAASCATVVAPVPKIYLNLEDVLDAIARRARRLAAPESFYLGKLQDALALDPLTGYSRVLIPFFARHPLARCVLLTKSVVVDNLLGLDHGGHTAASWSLNPACVCRQFEFGAPPLEDRLEAARRCAQAGYPVRFLIMPILPIDGWRQAYADLIDAIFDAVPPQRITLGGICSYPGALRLTARTLGPDNLIARHIAPTPSPDGRLRFLPELRTDLYRHILAAIRRHDAAIPVALCLEEPPLWHALGLDPAKPTCNCIW